MGPSRRIPGFGVTRVPGSSETSVFSVEDIREERRGDLLDLPTNSVQTGRIWSRCYTPGREISEG